MADFDELDDMLRESFARVAQPESSAGVADAIRARVAAGDSGASVAASTAPGWGGGLWSWMPWLGLVVVAGLVGGALGVSGVMGAPTQTVVAGHGVVLSETVAAAACPGGPVAGELGAGTRVVAVARSDESDWLGVRDPAHFDRVLWFERSLVVVDEPGADLAALPVDACPEVVVEVLKPEVEEDDEPEGGENPEPAPGDTTRPKVTEIDVDDMVCQATQTIYVAASDNVSVTAVTLSWTGHESGSASMSRNGSVWTYDFYGPNSDAAEVFTITATARDAAGNTGSASTNITVDCIG